VQRGAHTAGNFQLQEMVVNVMVLKRVFVFYKFGVSSLLNARLGNEAESEIKQRPLHTEGK